jgi:putative acetyltransferase
MKGSRRGHVLDGRLRLRRSRKADNSALAALHQDAFGGEVEAKLTLALLADRRPVISLVGECDGKIVGHVLLSEIGAPVRALALAPLAVAASHREMQIGSRLVVEAIELARKADYEAIFVLGDNAYYERFGFASPAAAPFQVEWQGPHFMALELKPGALRGKKGRLEYPAVFFGSDY